MYRIFLRVMSPYVKELRKDLYGNDFQRAMSALWKSMTPRHKKPYDDIVKYYKNGGSIHHDHPKSQSGQVGASGGTSGSLASERRNTMLGKRPHTPCIKEPKKSNAIIQKIGKSVSTMRSPESDVSQSTRKKRVHFDENTHDGDDE